MSVNNLRLANLPCFDLVSALTKIPSLRLADIDQHLPSQINFNYYSGAEFLNNQDILDLSTKKYFGVLHCNIRSLAANIDKVSLLLNDLKYPFSVIRLTETRIKHQIDILVNINLYGYTFLSQPSITNAGGVGLFVKEDLSYVPRNDLSISKTEFEALWIDIESKGQNIICVFLYRHPKANLEVFKNYLYSILGKIQNETSYVSF